MTVARLTSPDTCHPLRSLEFHSQTLLQELKWWGQSHRWHRHVLYLPEQESTLGFSCDVEAQEAQNQQNVISSFIEAHASHYLQAATDPHCMHDSNKGGIITAGSLLCNRMIKIAHPAWLLEFTGHCAVPFHVWFIVLLTILVFQRLSWWSR